MLSLSIDYALRATMHIAQCAPQPCTTQEVAVAMNAPAAYLAKILQTLRREGLLHSQRGVGGGMTLSRSAQKISLLDVINAVEPLTRRPCQAGRVGRSRSNMLCGLHAHVNRVLDRIEQSLATTSLADILTDTNCTTPVCSTPGTNGKDGARTTNL
jgi:Rrf2 family protein